MLDHPLPEISSWVNYFSEQELPVLRHTCRQLQVARDNMETVTSKDIARIVLQDPLMAVRVLSYIQPLTRNKRLHHDVTTVAGAIMMLGIKPFFTRFEHLASIEDKLRDAPPQALLGALRVIHRAQQASRYAYDWAVWRLDMNVEEVVLAALLHDLTETLFYCFAPQLALSVRALQQKNPQLRSDVAQRQILHGISARDIQSALCKAWHLPELLLKLIDDDHADHPRVKNVVLAVNLARHLAHGWQDTALPDDLKAIAQLLNLSEAALGQRLGLAPPESGASLAK
ncbi:MAG: HDOD domain-containing protein [Zoogloeaceae bacterium]|jgi:HD-like signal output (HDOD) protein|nr:HDOD domain-containing protein [Zoogloeaceae bacterium]